MTQTKHTGKGEILILWGNIDEKESLAIPDLFAFDLIDRWSKPNENGILHLWIGADHFSSRASA
jgi:hypothetical protein